MAYRSLCLDSKSDEGTIRGVKWIKALSLCLDSKSDEGTIVMRDRVQLACFALIPNQMRAQCRVRVPPISRALP